MSRLAMLSFRDVLVTPYTDLLDWPFGGEYHRGGPHWPDWDSQTAARHCHQGAPIDQKPVPTEPTTTLTDRVAWAGAITWAFGHQVADFATRLLPTLAEMPDARFAFSVRDELVRFLDVWEKTPDYFRDILAWFGITGERVEIITEPTLVERLVVAPQGEQYGGPGPEPWYLDLLDANMASRLGRIEPTGPLYVSRAGQRGRFAGEAYLERALENAGFRVLRPETVPLAEQMRAYAGADSIVFAEGSALHGAQLIGRALGDVTVLARRAGRKLGAPELTPRARSLRYVDAVRGLVHGLDIGGKPALYYGLSVLDPELLCAALPVREGWDQSEFEAARDADVREWLDAERESPRWAVAGSPELVSASLRAAGLARL